MACQVVYHNGNCLNTKKANVTPCRLCTDICPYQAISEFRRLDAGKCSECGACMAACPSDGFVDSQVDKFYDYLLGAEEIRLNCPKSVRSGFEIPCLGMLDQDNWKTLILLAGKKPVTIVTGECATCEDRLACSASVKAFKQVHTAWPGHAGVVIQVRPDTGEAAENKSADYALRETSGQGSLGNTSAGSTSEGKPSDEGSSDGKSSGGLFAARKVLQQKGMKKIEELLPNLTADQTYNIPKSRQGLVEVLQGYPDEKVPFEALAVTGVCTSCGVCAAICPQGALRKIEEKAPVSEPKPESGSEPGSNPPGEDAAQADSGRVRKGHGKEDRIEVLKLILEPEKCVHCGRCIKACRNHVLTFKNKMLNHRFMTGKVLIHEGSPLYCKKCGQRIFEDTDLCLVCSTSAPEGRGFFL